MTPRRLALLYAVRHGRMPWISDELDQETHGIDGAQEHGQQWLLCCGHVYTSVEIEMMVERGYLRIDQKLCRHGQRLTSAGPRIHEAWDSQV